MCRTIPIIYIFLIMLIAIPIRGDEDSDITQQIIKKYQLRIKEIGRAPSSKEDVSKEYVPEKYVPEEDVSEEDVTIDFSDNLPETGTKVEDPFDEKVEIEPLVSSPVAPQIKKAVPIIKIEKLKAPPLLFSRFLIGPFIMQQSSGIKNYSVGYQGQSLFTNEQYLRKTNLSYSRSQSTGNSGVTEFNLLSRIHANKQTGNWDFYALFSYDKLSNGDKIPVSSDIKLGFTGLKYNLYSDENLKEFSFGVIPMYRRFKSQSYPDLKSESKEFLTYSLEANIQFSFSKEWHLDSTFTFNILRDLANGDMKSSFNEMINHSDLSYRISNRVTFHFDFKYISDSKRVDAGVSKNDFSQAFLISFQ